MARPQEKLAESLEALEALQSRGVIAIRSADLSRTHRERLLKNGFLQTVMKGWYIRSRSDEPEGESTAWYASFWDFCAAYLDERFGEQWSLSAEQSLFLHTGNRTVPRQLLVRAPKARNQKTDLAQDSSLIETRARLPSKHECAMIDGLRVFSLPAALVAAGPALFAQNPTEARTALAMLHDASELLVPLLEGGRTSVAGRLAGALRNIGRDQMADEILKAMRSAGYKPQETDPFERPAPFTIATRAPSPYVLRMRFAWQRMREDVIAVFPKAPGLASDKASYLKSVDEVYLEDAYHSLSIEGYRVSRELVERVRSRKWHPDTDARDRSQRDAMAARGYYEAFQLVKKSVARVLDGANPSRIADRDHAAWYRALFSPGVAAGIVSAADLAGYRSGQVYIRHSKHVPPKCEAVRDLMPALFGSLTEETDPGARAVLGHFMFEYIHPYMDGNGRMGRFLMNLMLCAGGYPWTIVPVERRDDYLAALEVAGVAQDIKPLAAFLGGLVRDNL